MEIKSSVVPVFPQCKNNLCLHSPAAQLIHFCSHTSKVQATAFHPLPSGLQHLKLLTCSYIVSTECSQVHGAWWDSSQSTERASGYDVGTPSQSSGSLEESLLTGSSPKLFQFTSRAWGKTQENRPVGPPVPGQVVDKVILGAVGRHLNGNAITRHGQQGLTKGEP